MLEELPKEINIIFGQAKMKDCENYIRANVVINDSKILVNIYDATQMYGGCRRNQM